eukprot:TRINITY_DN4425_c0_g1_i1.p1 TRINITY_DN4425_c0_g1~~TRINITY_DN4425_c0_g1_i1.p1  ORF type:complete len:369 (-),score=96.02 TRINITY_DN4425_c0_g1_i1:30-1136(-)
MAMEEIQSIAELEESLDTYKSQLGEVNEALLSEPDNAEFMEVAAGLKEVIDLTEDLLKSAREGATGGPSEYGTGDAREPDGNDRLEPFSEERLQPIAFVSSGAGALPVSDSLPSSSGAREAEEIPGGRYPVGARVEAVWTGDGEWYEATVKSITPLGYILTYSGWGNTEEVDLANVRSPVHPPQAETSGASSRGQAAEAAAAAARVAAAAVAAGAETPAVNSMTEAERAAEAARLEIKRKLAEAATKDVSHKEIPYSLIIKKDDPEDVKAAKKKKLHAFKSKQRLENRELEQNKRQNSWQQFQTKEKKAKIAGFFTGRKRESIFKSPTDLKGKVGVTGSGKGLTDFQKREKYMPVNGGEEGQEGEQEG